MNLGPQEGTLKSDTPPVGAHLRNPDGELSGSILVVHSHFENIVQDIGRHVLDGGWGTTRLGPSGVDFRRCHGAAFRGRTQRDRSGVGYHVVTVEDWSQVVGSHDILEGFGIEFRKQGEEL